MSADKTVPLKQIRLVTFTLLVTINGFGLIYLKILSILVISTK